MSESIALPRRTLAGCLVAAPALMLAAHLLQPAHGVDTAAEVASARAHAGAYDASTVLGVLAVMTLVPAIAAMGALLRGRWSARVGVPLAHVGGVALAVLLGTGTATTAIAVHGGAEAVRLTEEVEGSLPFGITVAMFILGYTVGLITLAVGLWRARQVPAWVSALVVVAVLMPAVAGGRTPVAVGFGLLLVAFTAVARAVLRGAGVADDGVVGSVGPAAATPAAAGAARRGVDPA